MKDGYEARSYDKSSTRRRGDQQMKRDLYIAPLLEHVKPLIVEILEASPKPLTTNQVSKQLKALARERLRLLLRAPTYQFTYFAPTLLQQGKISRSKAPHSPRWLWSVPSRPRRGTRESVAV